MMSSNISNTNGDNLVKKKVAVSSIPMSMISSELDGLYGANVLAEFGEIIKLYDVYERGADFNVEGTADYTPANLKFKTAKTLIDKEARFLFSRKPDFNVNAVFDDEHVEQGKTDSSIFQDLINRVLARNNISRKLVQAAKDCFIGKRVACFINFNDDGIGLRFTPSLEFVFDTFEDDVDRLKKIVAFYTIKDDKSKTEQRIYKKKYWIADDGLCWFNEAEYDGMGVLVKEIEPDTKTLFTYIPAIVIINDGLTGDLTGVSEIEQLEDYESWYSRLANADVDAERKSMNPITYTIDMNSSSTANLGRAAGSYWDLHSDDAVGDGTKIGTAGTIENSMSYSAALDTTLKRIKRTMYQQVDVPDVEEIQAQLSSGKALKAIYWGLITRCDEKMLTWKPALEFIVRCIIDGVRLYPKSAIKYTMDKIPDVEFEVEVENQYPLPEDEQEEKQVDLSEVSAQTMSKKAYMKKWRGLTDDEADEEIKQIALEREQLENSFTPAFGEETDEDEEDETLPDETDDEDTLSQLDELEGLMKE